MRTIVIALALLVAQQGPPKDPAATRTADLVELVKLDPTIKLDIRYAGTNNFLGKPVYKEARAFLQRPAAEALLKAHRDLAKSGYGLMIHDGYLYVSLGDEGGADDAFRNSQRIDRDFFSGILRIDVDRRPGSLAAAGRHPGQATAPGLGHSTYLVLRLRSLIMHDRASVQPGSLAR